MVKQGGEWKEVDWNVALDYVAHGLKDISREHGGDALAALAALAAPASTRGATGSSIRSTCSSSSAAAVAAERGHQIDLFDAAPLLGGQLQPPRLQRAEQQPDDGRGGGTQSGGQCSSNTHTRRW